MVLRGIEQRLERIFEGVFGRAFRTNVQPVELARKLAKEMDDHRSASVRNVYVPNEYTIYLSPGDRGQFEGYENSLVSELEEYLSEHAARENYALLTPPGDAVSPPARARRPARAAASAGRRGRRYPGAAATPGGGSPGRTCSSRR